MILFIVATTVVGSGTGALPTGHVAPVANPFNTSYTAPSLSVLSGVEEKSRTAYWNNSSGAKHAVTVTVRFDGGKYVELPTGNVWPNQSVAVWVANYRITGVDDNGTVGTTTWTNNTTSEVFTKHTDNVSGVDQMAINDMRPRSFSNTIAVANPATAAVTGTAVNAVLTQGGGTTAALQWPASDTNLFYPQVSATGPLSTTNMPILVRGTKGYHKLVYADAIFDGGGGLTGSWLAFRYIEDINNYSYAYSVNKNLATAASIDSRRVYGTPNIEGEIPGDANAEQRNVIFYPWIFKGGLFVGNMPEGGADQSGRARIQLTASSSTSSSVKLTLLSLFYRGRPSTATNDLEIRAFIPDSGDTNYAQDITAVDWSKAWTFPSSGGVQLTLNSSTPADDYFNVLMGSACTKIGIGSVGEGSGSARWRYFGSKAYQDQFPSDFPANDSQARIWQVVLNSTATWQD